MASPKKAAQSNNAAAATTVRVRATQRGYWDHKLWEEGVVFDYALPAGQPLPTWMEQVRGRPAQEPHELDEETGTNGPTFSDDVI